MPALVGGVCVTSTALYRAVLDAGLEVVERHPHGVPLAWTNGDDATVSFHVDPDGSLKRDWDFRFRNDLENPLVITARRGGTTVRVELRGLRPLAVSVAPLYRYGSRLARCPTL